MSALWNELHNMNEKLSGSWTTLFNYYVKVDNSFVHFVNCVSAFRKFVKLNIPVYEKKKTVSTEWGATYKLLNAFTYIIVGYFFFLPPRREIARETRTTYTVS